MTGGYFEGRLSSATRIRTSEEPFGFDSAKFFDAFLATSLAIQPQKSHLLGGRLALYLKYRYGDSNPGFRTENCLCETICGGSVPVAPKEINPVPSSSVESGTDFGTLFGPPRQGIRRAR
jgi:hypothetical protein